MADIGTTIQSFGNILHTVFSSIRSILTSILGFLPYDKLLIMYLVLLVGSLVLSFLFFKKVISSSPISGRYFWWLLLLALILFIIFAFV